MKELTIEIRTDQISIQSPGIGENKEEAKKVLQDALDALDKEPAESYKNEIVINGKP